jgi:EmrB/QacA subfamily drug resistance transporter
MQVPARNARSGARSSNKWVVGLVIIFGMFAIIMDGTIVNIAIPHLQSAFGGSLSTVQWVLTGYLLAQGVATPLTPYLAGRLGTKSLWLVGLSLFTLFSALCGLAWSLPALIFFRILQGAGGAFLGPIAITLLYSAFLPEERGIAMGVLGIPILFAPALGPTLGGYLITFVSWQLIFYINVPVGIIGVILAALVLRELPQEAQTRFDGPGFLFSALGLGAVLYAFSQTSTDGWGSTTVLGFLGGGLLALLFFVLVELNTIDRGGQPLLDLRISVDRAFAPSMIASMFLTFIFFGGLFMVPLYLQSLRGLSAFQSGLLLLPQALVSVVVAVIGGRLTDKLGTLPIVLAGLLFLVYPLWGLSHLTTSTPYGWLQVLLIMRAAEIGLVFQPLMRAALVRIPAVQMNQASSLSTVIRLVASSVSGAILGTYVQTQQKLHYTHLAEQVTPGSPLGQLISVVQTSWQARGMDLLSAHNAAIHTVILLLLQQDYALALQDGFRLTLWIMVPALLAVLLLPAELRKAPPRTKKAEGTPTAQRVGEEALSLG